MGLKTGESDSKVFKNFKVAGLTGCMSSGKVSSNERNHKKHLPILSTLDSLKLQCRRATNNRARQSSKKFGNLSDQVMLNALNEYVE